MGTIAKQSIKGTIVTYIGVMVGFFTTFFVLTRFLSATEIGLARVLIDAATLFIGLAQLGTNSSIIRFFPYFKDGGRNHGFFFWTILVPFIGFILFSLVYWACSTPLAAWFGENSPLFVNYYWFVLPLAFFMLYQSVFESNANVLMHIVVPRAVREIGVRIGLLTTYLLYAFEVLSMTGYVIALCVTYAVAAAINIAYLFSLGQISLRPDMTFLKDNPQLVRRIGIYTGFLIISALTSVLAPTLSGFFITAKMGLEFTGIFAIATYIGVMVSIPYRSLVAITQPELAQTIKDNDKPNTTRLIAQASNNLMLVGGFIFLLIWINIDLIFALLPNGETYAVAKNTVLLLSLGQWMIASFNIFNSALSYSRFYAVTLLNSCVLTVSALLLNNALIPLYGMDGAALATVLSDVAYYVLAVGVTCAALRLQPFNRRHLLTVLLLVALFALNHLLLPLHCLIRTVILVGGGLALAYVLHLSPEIDALLRRIRL
ncbi:MAG: lipopolysaccharide biosynthesis protein [Paludibacteraceae bacterium]|nr:lipopolysaccharide biosynthesis protein [Paludibacteraceae bacterium]